MENYFNNIQNYLDGLLSEKEKQEFDAELASNAQLKKETQAQRHLIEVLSSRMKAAAGLNELNATFTRNRKKYFANSDSSISSRKVFTLRNWSIAVGIAACFLIGLSYFGVFSSNLASLPALQSEITRGSNNQNIINEAIVSYNNKAYKKSIRLFSELTESHPEAVRFKYYLGLSFIGNTQWEKAVETLIPVADGASLYSENAAYFTAVAAGELKNKKLAKKFAKKVSEGNKYYEKAQQLIKKID